MFSGNSLRIGAFGARRPLKNFMSAAGATVEVATQFDANLEVGVSAGRAEGGRNTRSVNAMIAGLPNIRLVECGWQSWPRFRTTARHVHLLLQPSYTESFNMVTADGIAEGAPSVVSEAIDWPPDHRKAPIDDVHQMARVPAICSPIRMPRRRASGAGASQSRRVGSLESFPGGIGVRARKPHPNVHRVCPDASS